MTANITTSNFGYAQALSSADYSLGTNDFTIQFWVNQYNQANIQTLFEIADDADQTRFIALANDGVVELMYANVILTQDYNANDTFTINGANANTLAVFYDGSLLSSNAWSLTSNVLTITNPQSGNVRVDAATIEFNLVGPTLSANTNYFFDIERIDGNLHIILDGNDLYFGEANLSIPNANAGILTVGANQNGWNPFTGYFGDFKVTNGIARSLSPTQANIYSLFDSNCTPIVVTGSQFQDISTVPAPEELFPGQGFDTLNLQVYQVNSSNVFQLGWRIFKSAALSGPVTNFDFTANTSGTTFIVPWQNTIYADSCVVEVNDTVLASNQFSISSGNIIFASALSASDQVSIELTGQTSYFQICNSYSTTLTQPLYIWSPSIQVESTSGFGNSGMIFINGEIVSFTGANSTALTGIFRGAMGTPVADTYPTGTEIMIAEGLPANSGQMTWYTHGANTAANGQGLANSNTYMASLLLSCPS